MNKKAFTLAEVLITLTIIGVIAALTIPTLMRKYEDHQTVSAVKEMYAIIDNALKKVISEEGITDLYELSWPVPTGGESTAYINPNSNLLYTKMKSHLKIEKDTDVRSGILSNGAEIKLSIDRPYRKTDNCYDYLGHIGFDINGSKKGPNKWGYDNFTFEIVPTGLNVPVYPGGRYQICSGHSMAKAEACKTGSVSITTAHNPLSSCSTWIMLHGNVDYKYKTVEQGIYTFFK